MRRRSTVAAAATYLVLDVDVDSAVSNEQSCDLPASERSRNVQRCVAVLLS